MGIIEAEFLEEIRNTKDVLAKLISWTAQSAGSPIGLQEAGELLNQLDTTQPPAEKNQ